MPKPKTQCLLLSRTSFTMGGGEDGDFLTKTLLGRKYHVYPSTLMVEGAYYPNLEGAQEGEALFFDGEDLRRSVISWNGRPVTLNHPPDSTASNTPHVYESQWVGYLFGAEYNSSSKKLKADVWVDSERGRDIVDLVDNGGEVDVSIGAYGNIVYSNGVAQNGEEYEIQMSNLIGDHLAILPDSRGACSWEDGCGLTAEHGGMERVVLGYRKFNLALRTTARVPSYTGVETTSWEKVGRRLRDYIDGFYKHSKETKPSDISYLVSDLPGRVKEWIASRSLLGQTDTTAWMNLSFFPVVNPSTNKLNEGALKAVLSGRGSQANISSRTLESARKVANRLLEKEFGTKKVNQKKEVGDVRMTKECETNFDITKWLEQAPLEVSEKVRASMDVYESAREEYTRDIVQFSNVDFCKKELGEIKDMGTLKKVAALAKTAHSLGEGIEALEKEREEENEKMNANNGPVNANYSMKNTRPGRQLDYAEFKDITWNNPN